jgi:hypothetical protein
MFGCDLRGYGGHIGLSLLNGNPRLEPPHGKQPVVIMIDLFGPKRQWCHEFRVQAHLAPEYLPLRNEIR